MVLKQNLLTQSLNRTKWSWALKEGVVAFSTAATLLLICYSSAFQWIHAELVPFMNHQVSPLVTAGKDLVPISVGAHRVDGNSVVIESLNGDEAILVLPRSLQAEHYPFIKFNAQGYSRHLKFKILWRRADDISITHALELHRNYSDETLQVNMAAARANYGGKIADVALLIFRDPSFIPEAERDREIRISHIQLLPFGARNMFEQIMADWLSPPLWSGSANNIVRGVHQHGLVTPNLVWNLIFWLGACIVLARNPPHVSSSWKSYGHSLLVLLLLCWSLSEIPRWASRAEQIKDTLNRYAGMSISQKRARSDILCGRVDLDCLSDQY